MNQITPVIYINCREGSLPDRSGKSPRADPHHDEWVAVPSGTEEGLARNGPGVLCCPLERQWSLSHYAHMKIHPDNKYESKALKVSEKYGMIVMSSE